MPFAIFSQDLPAQCDIKNKIGIDGSLYYYIGPVRFYWTTEKQLEGGIVTDKEHYFLTLYPSPFPDRKTAEKLRDRIDVTLSNSKQYSLENFNSHYDKSDSSFRMMFLIDKKMLDDFGSNDVEQVKINMGDSSGIRTYNFRLHKSAIKEHLGCFLNKK